MDKYLSFYIHGTLNWLLKAINRIEKMIWPNNFIFIGSLMIVRLNGQIIVAYIASLWFIELRKWCVVE